MSSIIAALNNLTVIQESTDGGRAMDLDNSNLKTISEYLKTSSNHDNEGTGEHNHRISPQNNDYFSKIAQAMNKVERLLFNHYESNQDSHLIVSECHENNDITTEDKVKLLSAQVESLQKLLLAKEAEVQATQQELNHTNQDLVAALNTNILTLAEAKGFVRNMLPGKESIYQYLAKLLSAIYNSTVDASELAPISNIDQDNLTTSIFNIRHHGLNAEFEKLTSMNETLKHESATLRCESINLRNKLAELKAKSKSIISKSASWRNK